MSFKKQGFKKCKDCRKELRSAADYGKVFYDGSIRCAQCQQRSALNLLLSGMNRK